MKFNFYYFLPVIALGNASPNPQVAAASNAALPSVPISKVPPTPSPFANAALWQEAVTNDAKLGGSSTTNQYFYAMVAYAQTLENSSNSIIADYINGAEATSKALQSFMCYPTEFNQAQALNPATTQGMSDS